MSTRKNRGKPLVYSKELGRKTTEKMIRAIKNNKGGK